MSAYARVTAAIALAVSVAAFAVPAAAADLYEPPYDRHGEGYGEGPPPPQRDRYGDVPDDFEPPYPPPRYAGRDSACIPKELARDRLQDAGWYDFHGLEARDDIVYVKARRPSGRLFDLTIDRCSGQIVDARPVFGGRRDDYAWGAGPGWGREPGPRRHWAPY